MVDTADHALPPVQQPAGQGRRAAPRLVSIVVPVFNEIPNVGPLIEAVEAALGTQPYEILFVDDGSTDGTPAEIETHAARDDRICAVVLSRNFGHQHALAAGLRCARGDVVVTMDGDLQHPPGLIPTLIERWQEGANIVHTRRADTEDLPGFKRLTSRAFYRVFGWLSDVPLEPGMADFRLLDRRVVDELNRMQDGRLFLRALLRWMGYRSAIVPFTPGQRHAGRSKYTTRRMLRLATDGTLAFSTVPLRVGLLIGTATAVLSFIELLFVVIAWLMGRTVPGWASTVGVVAFLFGVLFILLGIQGQYILRLYEQARARPPFIIERIVRRTDERE